MDTTHRGGARSLRWMAWGPDRNGPGGRTMGDVADSEGGAKGVAADSGGGIKGEAAGPAVEI